MINIDFLQEHLKEKIEKQVTISMSGILKFTSNILKFQFEINGNNLKIKDNKKEIIEINFDEVSKVEFIEKNKIYIFFNVNEFIIIK
jgi:hypothetical protein